MRWTEIKKRLQAKGDREALNLLRDLYNLSEDNKRFVISRIAGAGHSAIDAFKHEITVSLNPDWEDPIDLRRGRKAISDYKKAAPDDKAGCLDLMIHYVESGNAQTLKYGDIDGAFYDSLCSMLDRIARLAPKLDIKTHADCSLRLRILADRTSGKIGWGYADHLDAVTEGLETDLETRSRTVTDT